MGRHRAVSARRARVIIGGVVAGGALAVVAPAALASADPATPGEVTGGRPDFRNPAPVVRGIQSIGDSTFDPNDVDDPITRQVRSSLNGSVIGDAYHEGFGYSQTGADAYNEANGLEEDDPGFKEASNGRVTGVLNTGLGGNGEGNPTTIPGKVYAQTVNIRECQVEWDDESGAWLGIDRTGSRCN